MVISGDVLTFRDKGRSKAAMSCLAASVRLVLAFLLIVLIAAVPAEAAKKRKKVRYHYAPPQAAMVVDLHSGKVLHEENADKARFPASVTKVMTLYILFEQMRKGEFRPDSELKVSEWAASRPPSKLGLKPGQTIKVSDAMGALVTKSANDVASVVAENIAGSEEAFARMMTHKARMIGMKDTIFANASGLPDDDQRTTARDLITLGRRVLQDFPEEAKIFQTRFFEYDDRTYQNHNRMLFSYAGMEGMKTGYTRASGFNLLASCRRGDKHLLAVVLGGSSSRHRNGKMRTLLDRSWRSAIAMKDGPKRFPEQPLAMASAAPLDMMPERNPAFHETVTSEPLQVTIGKEARPGQEIDIDKELATNAGAEDESDEEEAEAEEAGEQEAPQIAVASTAGKDDAEAAAGEGDLKPEAEAKAAAVNVNPSPVAVALMNQEQEQGQSEQQEQRQGPQEQSQEQGQEQSQGPQQEQPVLGPYHVQVGSFFDTESAKRKLELVAEKADGLLEGHEELTVAGDVKGKAHYRARFGKFTRKDAASTCSKLKRMKVECLVVRVE